MKGSVPDPRVGLTFDDVLLVPRCSHLRSRRNKGRVKEVVWEFAGTSYSEAHALSEPRRKAVFTRITSAGYRESLPHDIQKVV